MFGNGYSPYPAVVPPMLRARGGALLLLAVTAVALVAGPAGAAVTLPSYDTGAVRVTLPSAVPTFELAQDANASISATVTLERIVELAPTANDSSDGPEIVAAAFPTDVHTYNVSSVTSGGFEMILTATLVAYRTSGVLFPPRNALSHVEPLVAIAPTSLAVTVASGSSPGLFDVSTVITGWPWASSGDLLALLWGLSTPIATGLAGCSSAPSDGVPASACGASPVSTAAPAEWGTPLQAVQELGSRGPVAQLTWSPGAAGSAAGTESGPNGSAEVVVGEPATTAANETFAMQYALTVPNVLVPLVLHGSWVPYLGGLALAGLLGAAGLVYARWRDRRALESL